MKTINWTQLVKNYSGLWVALRQDEKTVITSGKNAKKVYETAKKSSVGIPTLVKVPTKLLPYVG